MSARRYLRPVWGLGAMTATAPSTWHRAGASPEPLSQRFVSHFTGHKGFCSHGLSCCPRVLQVKNDRSSLNVNTRNRSPDLT